MTTTCPRCHTYCYGDCTASEGRSTRTSYAPRQQASPRATSEPTIIFRNIRKTRSAWIQRLAEDEARLERITDPSARELTEKQIAELRAALEG